MMSYSMGPLEPSVPEGTIGEQLDRIAAENGAGEALVIASQDVRWTWVELRDRTDALVRGFAKLGLTVGDRVGICAPNCAEWVLTQLATARLGLVLVSINPAYRTHELGHALRLAGVRALVTAKQFKTSDYVSMIAELIPASNSDEVAPLFDPTLPDLRYVIEIGGATARARIGFDSLLLADDNPIPTVKLDADQAINIQFTSGTTGAPKGATLSHRNLLHNAVCSAAGMRLGADDRLCIPVPLYHCFGMVLGVLVCLVSGATMVFPGQTFDAGDVLKTISAERCTGLHGVPTMFLAVLDHPEFGKADLTSLRTGIAAGALCPAPMMRRMIDDMNLSDITIGYGMTETSPLSTQTLPDADLVTRTETVGTMMPYFEGRVIDPAGNLVPLGATGEYCSRGPGVMLGYWSQPEATAAAIRDGWMHSGDLATMDEQGRVRIVGRIKDMIIRGGENIYPAEVEAFLATHPAIAEVAVFGVPCERLGEQVCAWIRPRWPIDANEVLAWSRGKISHQKIPSRIRVVDAFPMTVTGKIQKFAMRDIEQGNISM
ncbi:fatty-acyl-CoA synthase [Sphingomonas sp. PP-F2F-A104-K0414]|uniref:AMP-binding protein n=1 Tax=Sphingomonas sp. PP-F2F-A104-K0414 TaxID=2135661 RepID=UPI00104BC2E3|nr:AMP-binding protein [Sphingomonas sp. PP-F2F-A104-K0414]TCP97415.1 fatty-acyl-CoA synthase [Sphingomonas sp. PP-F2F-A104-K0414]